MFDTIGFGLDIPETVQNKRDQMFGVTAERMKEMMTDPDGNDPETVEQFEEMSVDEVRSLLDDMADADDSPMIKGNGGRYWVSSKDEGWAFIEEHADDPSEHTE